ncbi:MAG: ABC transporter permease [Deltaproteobacteria bacterium]|nr:ABC transporter permease [Deltaproteobacteria bacterium]
MLTSQAVSEKEEKGQASKGFRLKRVLRGIPWTPAFILILFLVFGIFGNFLTPHDPLKTDLRAVKKPPFFQQAGDFKHLLGTDNIGRDILSRIITGAGVSLQVGFAVVVFAGALGAIVALFSAYLGGWVDVVLMRITDMFLSMPFLIIAIALAAVLGPSKNNVILIMGILGWAGYARVLRGEVLRMKNADFIKLAIVARAGKMRVMFQHIFPNIVNTLVVLATLQLGNVIIMESSLSFLGLGVPPPEPAWGSMVADGRVIMNTAWWICTWPGIAIFLVVMSSNLLGDWLRLRLDPKFRQL